MGWFCVTEGVSEVRWALDHHGRGLEGMSYIPLLVAVTLSHGNINSCWGLLDTLTWRMTSQPHMMLGTVVKFSFPVNWLKTPGHSRGQLEWNNQWVTRCNPYLSSLIQSNHQFIPTLNMALMTVCLWRIMPPRAISGARNTSWPNCYYPETIILSREHRPGIKTHG